MDYPNVAVLNYLGTEDESNFILVQKQTDPNVGFGRMEMTVFARKIGDSEVTVEEVREWVAAKTNGYNPKYRRHYVTYWLRNYHYSVHALIRQDDRDILIVSEHYHGGHGFIDLETGARLSYTQPSFDAATGHQPQHFCWAKIAAYDPDRKVIEVNGCYWGGPYEFYEFDVSSIGALPWPSRYLRDARRR